MAMVNGIGANLTNEEKRAHLIDLRREHLIDQVCPQEILPPEQIRAPSAAQCSIPLINGLPSDVWSLAF
jgi:hypothetical protein